MSGLLKGKNIVVMGVANQRSIAWGITKSLHREGANLIFTNRQERSYQKLQKLLEENDIEAKVMVTCDVAVMKVLKKLLKKLKRKLVQSTVSFTP